MVGEGKIEISLKQLFIDFLMIGSTSFGGFMALISIVEKQIVEKRQLISSESLLNTISIASALPGPMAVNVVATIGYKLGGMRGAMICMAGILLPTYILIVTLSWLYFRYGELPEINNVFKGILPVVCAIIIAVAINMAKKHLNDFRLMILCAIAFVAFVFIGGFYINLSLMVFGGIIGLLLFRDKTSKEVSISSSDIYLILKEFFIKHKYFFISLTAIFILIIISTFIIKNNFALWNTLRALILTFSGVSITLFGGGYVFIPLLQDLIVEQLGWITNQEFIDGIALGQITPGPIMISAAFIGFKKAGILGSLVSTIAIFLPPALLMIFVSSFFDKVKNSLTINAIMKGIRAVVIGMIFAASWVIGKNFLFQVVPGLIFIVAFVLTYRFKVSVIILIPVSGVMGYFLI